MLELVRLADVDDVVGTGLSGHDDLQVRLVHVTEGHL